MTFVMADITGPREDLPEAEPVLIEVDGHGVRFVLDDGTTVAFDRSELMDVLSPAQPSRRAA